jgi:hypothetical protein
MSWWRAAVYDSPVLAMRVRTRRLNVFWVGIVYDILLSRRRHGTHAPAARRRRADDPSRESEFPFAPSMPTA